jgi:putative aldouronate transport system permease protein
MAVKTGRSIGERIFDVFNIILMVLLMILMIYPFWHIIMYSLSEVHLSMKGGLFLWWRGFTLHTYKTILRNPAVASGFKVSLIVTIVGTIYATFFTATTAYPLSKRRLKGRGFFSLYVLFTMLFNGGMIPTYLLVKNLKLIDNILALILPGAIGAWNIFIMRNFFATIPESLEESARIDGASDILIFFKIIIPLSKAVLATIGLFVAVGYWNNYFSTILYINSRNLWSLQAVLREIITSTEEAMKRQGITVTHAQTITTQSVISANIVIATVPILLVYPFAQKYFIRGVMIGSVKG